MKVEMNKIYMGNLYTQKELATIWQYKSYHAIRRGIVTPSKKKIIILFITEDKVSHATQYSDTLVFPHLYMQGENKHSNDKRLLTNLNYNSDEIHLFHRKKHHSPFTYLGTVNLIKATINKTAPSDFVFKLVNKISDI